MKKNDVLDFHVLDARGPGLGGDSPGPDLRGDQLQGSDQEGGQLGAAGEEEKMLIKQLIRELEIAESLNGNNEVFFENYEFDKESYTFLRVDRVHVLDPETHPFVLLRCEAPAELKEEKRKRLMDGLEKCSRIRTNEQDVCQKCPYFKEEDCTGMLAKDALARIKELESK